MRPTQSLCAIWNYGPKAPGQMERLASRQPHALMTTRLVLCPGGSRAWTLRVLAMGWQWPLKYLKSLAEFHALQPAHIVQPSDFINENAQKRTGCRPLTTPEVWGQEKSPLKKSRYVMRMSSALA